jgi:pyrimidine-nucleoside phosphorylase
MKDWKEGFMLAGKGEISVCKKMAQKTIDDGSAFAKLKEMVAAQGGDTRVLDDAANFAQASVSHEVPAQKEGYLYAMNTEQCGICSVELGAGREKKEDAIDFSAGILLHKQIGDYVKIGESIATFYSSEQSKCIEAEKLFEHAVVIRSQKPKAVPIIHARVTKDGIERYE